MPDSPAATPAATPAEPSDRTAGPLAGIRVVELAAIGPAPFAAMILAELGADVVRVERPGGISPFARGTGLNRSRPNVAVDIRTDAGREVVLRLLESADVLVEGMRPGAAERLGLGPDDCLARNPQLVYGRMTGWGQEGPLAQTAGHDLTYAAITGGLHLVGEPGRKPVPPANVLADFGGGSLYLVVGILAALHARIGTRRGQVVDAAMVDGASSLVTMIYGLLGNGLWQDRRGSNVIDGGAPFYDTYACADGRHVAVGALEPQFFAALVDGLGVEVPGTQDDLTTWPAMREALAAAFATRTRDEWAAHFEGTDACVAPVLSLAEAPRHPHLVARGTFTDVGGSPAPRMAPRFSETPTPEPTPEREPGADTVEVLRRNDFTSDEIAALLASGAIVQAD